MTAPLKTLRIAGHRVTVIDGTETEGIGQLGPFAVRWRSAWHPGGGPLTVAETSDCHADSYNVVLWIVQRDKATGHTRWVRPGRDDNL